MSSTILVAEGFRRLGAFGILPEFLAEGIGHTLANGITDGVDFFVELTLFTFLFTFRLTVFFG